MKAQPALTPSDGDWVLAVAPMRRRSRDGHLRRAAPPRPADAAAPWGVPVALLWPASASRADATVRVWSSASAPRAIHTSSAWLRELVAEPSADRDTLPATTPAASGAEMPLLLDVREVENPAAVAVWVERGLIQAWAAGDGATEYRARFLLRRWLAPAVEIRLPGPLAGANPEFRLDGMKVNATPLPDTGGVERAFRVPLPAPGKPVAVEVRYQVPAMQGRTGEAVYLPPILPVAAFTGPVRWQVTLPTGALPLLTAGGTAEFRWRLSATGVAPLPLAASESLERWFQTGEEPAGKQARRP